MTKNGWTKIIAKCKDVILHTPIIRNACGDMKALIDSWDEQELYIISDRNVATREKNMDIIKLYDPRYDSTERRFA